MSRYTAPPGLPITDRDLIHLQRSGWIPVTTIPALEEMRVKHEQLVEQYDAVASHEVSVRRGFDLEDEMKAAALRTSYRDGGNVELFELTSDAERDRQRAEAEQHTLAAGFALLDFAAECVKRLTGTLPDDWNPWLAAQSLKVPPDGEAAAVLAQLDQDEAAVRAEVEELQRKLSEATDKLRGNLPFRQWLARNANGGNDQIEPAASFAIAPTHTPGSKPRDLYVPDWMPDADGMRSAPQPVGLLDSALGERVVAQHDDGGGYFEDPDEPAGPLTPIAKEEF